ncbi:3-hydroxyacyl-CoA dehydrogenase [Paracoccaceae bacterium]|nr:3-hydroxyacyl-CoA dehydrogenase [Paracoccaceae bacterium]
MDEEQYILEAEKRALDIKGLTESIPKREINTVGVIGAGTMGGGISMNFANVGIPVHIVETSQDNLDKGLDNISNNYERSVNRGKVSEEQVTDSLKLITSSTQMTDLGHCDMIIEAVYEDLDLKKKIFKELDKIARPFSILATNTSALDINQIALSTLRPDDVIGLHFFSPANVMKLVEIVRAKFTSDVVVASSLLLVNKINKIPTVVGVCPGFVGNRILFARQKQALNMVYKGLMPWDIDKAINEFGFKMGPFQMSDLAGLDIGWKKGEKTTNPIRDALCELDRRGQKTNAGYYDYDENRVPRISKLTEELIKDITGKEKEQNINSAEIIEQCIFPMINEALLILEEGMAQRPSDIDVVWLNGYGFPKDKGGLLFWANKVGGSKILEGLKKMEGSGLEIKISGMLEDMVKRNKNIFDTEDKKIRV